MSCSWVVVKVKICCTAFDLELRFGGCVPLVCDPIDLQVVQICKPGIWKEVKVDRSNLSVVWNRHSPSEVSVD